MGRKLEVQETVNKDFYFSKQFLRPRQNGPRGTCHACHTLDTPCRQERVYSIKDVKAFVINVPSPLQGFFIYFIWRLWKVNPATFDGMLHFPFQIQVF